MAKAMDLFMWELEISDREKMRPILFELAADVEPKHGVRLRQMSFWRLRKEMDRFADVYNSAWARELGLRAVLEGGPRHATRRSCSSSSTSRGSWSPSATSETVAVAITMPDINQVLREDERAAAAVRLVALPAPQARSSTACGSASSA